MRLDGSIVRYQPLSHAKPKSLNWEIHNENDDREIGKTASPINVTNLISQKQLPDTLHAKANVILSQYHENFFLFYTLKRLHSAQCAHAMLALVH